MGWRPEFQDGAQIKNSEAAPTCYISTLYGF
jgi:hypothetical protein